MSGPELAGWVREGTEAAIPIAQALAVLLAAWLLLRVLRLVVKRLCAHYHLPAQVAVSARRLLGVVVYVSAFMVALGRLGVSARPASPRWPPSRSSPPGACCPTSSAAC